MNYPHLVFILSAVGLSLSSWCGAALRKRRGFKEDLREDYGVVQTATLTMLALIIGFTFSMAVNRYDQRKDREAVEANTIGTEYLRLGLLPADAVRIRALIVNYLDQRILFYETRTSSSLRRQMREPCSCKPTCGPPCRPQGPLGLTLLRRWPWPA